MELIKNYKHCIVGSGTFIAAICLLVCLGCGVEGKVIMPDRTIYAITFGEQALSGMVVAWVFLLLGVLAGVISTIMLCLKKNAHVAGYIATGASVLFLVSGILYFSVLAFAGTTYYDIGAAAIWNGVLLMIAFFVTLCGAVAAAFEKEDKKENKSKAK